jgi:hypothetical protein
MRRVSRYHMHDQVHDRVRQIMRGPGPEPASTGTIWPLLAVAGMLMLANLFMATPGP